MKSISLKVSDELKAQVEELAKKNRMNVSKLLTQLLEKELKKGEAATTLYDSDRELISNTVKYFTEKGLKANNFVDVAMADEKSLLYVPDLWLVEAKEATEKIKASDGILKRLKIKDYTLVDKTSSLVEKALKSYNFRARQKANTADEMIEAIFKKKFENPLLLIEKLDPIKLSKFCKEHSDKKVFYILGTQDVKVNRQVV